MTTSDERKDFAVRCVLVPLAGAHLLLPNSCLAEVVNYQPPQLQEDTPPWLLGVIDWRGETIALVEVESLLGLAPPTPGQRSRITVCTALRGDSSFGYYGILADSVPRQARITIENIAPSDPQADGPIAMQWVHVASEQAAIPDLDALEAEIAKLSLSTA